MCTEPVIQRFANCLVRMYPSDHAPPHFHIVMNVGREAWVRIETAEIIHGKLTVREVADVLEWAASHREYLAGKFEELQR